MKVAPKLTALAVERLRGNGVHAVGGVRGLYLQITSSTARSWILRVKVGEKRRHFGLGPYPAVSLQQARQAAFQLRSELDAGIDPAAAKAAAKAELVLQASSSVTFKQCAEEFLAGKLLELRSAHSRKNYRQRIENHAYPTLGSLPVSSVTLQHVTQCLEPNWLSKTSTMSEVRSQIEKVLAFAIVKGYRSKDSDNPARWRGNLEVVLPAPSKIAETEHHEAMPYSDVPAFMQQLAATDTMPAHLVRFIILTACRKNEARQAAWDEFDLEAGLWTIPADRMKAHREHVVPLSNPAIALLRSLPCSSNGYVFTGTKPGKPIGNTASFELLGKLEAGCTLHGFRTSFKTWSQENGHDDEVSELCLAHVVGSAVRCSYARSELLEARRELLAAWGAFVAPAIKQCRSENRALSVASGWPTKRLTSATEQAVK